MKSREVMCNLHFRQLKKIPPKDSQLTHKIYIHINVMGRSDPKLRNALISWNEQRRLLAARAVAAAKHLS